MIYIFSYDKGSFRGTTLSLHDIAQVALRRKRRRKGDRRRREVEKEKNKKGCALESHSGMYQEETALAFLTGRSISTSCPRPKWATVVWEQSSFRVSGLHSAECQLGISRTSWASDYGFVPHSEAPSFNANSVTLEREWKVKGHLDKSGWSLAVSKNKHSLRWSSVWLRRKRSQCVAADLERIASSDVIYCCGHRTLPLLAALGCSNMQPVHVAPCNDLKKALHGWPTNTLMKVKKKGKCHTRTELMLQATSKPSTAVCPSGCIL